jgi:voltage-gated potassium channel
MKKRGRASNVTPRPPSALITHPGSRGFQTGISLGQSVGLRDALRPFRIRFIWAAVYFLVAFLVGTLGYWIIEDWRWADALYMAVTTVSSVGFMEVYPLSATGRTFTMLLIFLGITGLGIWWALITALIVELDLAGVLRGRRIMKSIESLSDHSSFAARDGWAAL